VTVAVAQLRAAVGFLTRLPTVVAGDATGQAAYGVVGAIVGVAGGIVLLALGARVPLAAAALALAAMAVLTGGLHLDGLADTFDALAASDAARAEEARADPRIGAVGAAAVVLVIVIQASLLAAIAAGFGATAAAAACVSAAACSRGAAALLPALAPRAQGDESGRQGQAGGSGAWFIARARPVAAAFAVTSALAIAAILGFAIGRIAIPIGALGGVAATLVAGLWLVQLRGQLDGDGFGALIEVGFVACLLAMVLTL
jgi:adenosylcobinamide-GDP ribazoletransferase